MADVKICDRCGKTIQASLVKKFGLTAWRYSLTDHNARWKTSYDCDLCVDCGKKLDKFLKGWDPDERPDDALIMAR